MGQGTVGQVADENEFVRTLRSGQTSNRSSVGLHHNGIGFIVVGADGGDHGAAAPEGSVKASRNRTRPAR
jgi:hypothetical protein